MPQTGETPLARLAQAIVRGDGFSIGTPIAGEGRTTVVLPIRRVRRGVRRYVLAVEVTEGVSAVDPGRLDRLHVRNGSERRVFLPPGALFEGKETPSRGTTAGVLLDPGSEVEVEVKCVHPSQELAPRAILRLVLGRAPDRVRRALLTRDQGRVWAAVREVAGTSPGSDDLVGFLVPPNRIPEDSEQRPTGLVRDGDQCGAIEVDAEGVVAIEFFDHPESWQAASTLLPDGMPSELPAARAPALGLGVDAERAIRAAKGFLVEVAAAEYRRVAANGWTALDGSSACTVLDEEIIHFIAFGRPDDRISPSARGLTGPPEGLSWATGSDDLAGLASPAGRRVGEGDVTVAEVAVVDPDEVSEPDEPVRHPLRRKVLTSGWDAPTFESLERCARKEFGGDRSAAMRAFVRQGLRRRGYFGPQPPPRTAAAVTSGPLDEDLPDAETRRGIVEARIRDYERIALTPSFAEWLRSRARVELGRMALSIEEPSLREAAHSAFSRLQPIDASPEAPEPAEMEAPPAAPPLDVRPLLRRAFSASAGGQYAEALRRFDDVLEAEPDNRTALLGRAVALRRSGKAPEALAALDRVLELEPNNAAALLNRGRVLAERNDYRGALDTFDRLAGVAPNDWDVWMARGDILVRMGKDHEALGAYSEALRRNPDDETLQAKIRALERARPAPVPGVLSSASLPRDVQEGQSYLVKEARPDLSLRLFRALAGRGVPCLWLTRGPAEPAGADPGLRAVRILELSHAPGDARVGPDSLALLARSVERFLEEHHGRGVVLLDSLRPLLADNGFRDTVLFIERIHETVLQSPAIFLISVAPGDLAEREGALLERNLRVLT